MRIAKIGPQHGSSPRMRGALLHLHGRHVGKRIIPADAGSTARVWFSSGSPAEDHPRGCGEHFHSAWDNVVGWGSSPRMRGALFRAFQVRIPGRIIPADAGSTGARAKVEQPTGDHPRGCGEYNTLKQFLSSLTGSSPRMRGAPVSRAVHTRTRGIIPADAGSTATEGVWYVNPEDHPR